MLSHPLRLRSAAMHPDLASTHREEISSSRNYSKRFLLSVGLRCGIGTAARAKPTSEHSEGARLHKGFGTDEPLKGRAGISDDIAPDFRSGRSISRSDLPKTKGPLVSGPSSNSAKPEKSGAGEGARTLDPDLGKVVLYH